MEELRKLLRRDWPYLAGIIVFFSLMVVGGYFLSLSHPQLAGEFQKTFFGPLRRIAKLMKGQPVLVQVMIIWFNNMSASLSAIAIGVFLGIFPLLSLMGNGLAIGMMQHIVEQKGLNAAQFYLGLLPHGVFELPAFFMAVWLGIRLGIIPFRLIWQRHMTTEHRPLWRIYFREARYYLSLIIVLLFVAAVIEITVSPMLLK